MPEEKNKDIKKRKWWGEFDLHPGKWARWKIGPKDFFARSMGDEWRFAWRTGHDMLSEEVRFESPTDQEPSDADSTEPEFELRRYALEDAHNRLRLTPKLADRPVIVRPETPLYLPPGQRTVLYVSTGVWVAVAPPSMDDQFLFEVPIYRASDTWFGPNTLTGELCYTAVTSARTNPSLLAQVPHRAFTPIDITNNGGDALEIEYLRVPVTQLSLYAGAKGRLWTDKITFEREQGESSASLKISAHEGLEAGPDSRLSGPREPESAGIVHSFSRIFGKDK